MQHHCSLAHPLPPGLEYGNISLSRGKYCGFCPAGLLAAQPWGAAPRGLWQRGGSVVARGHTAVVVTAVPSVTDVVCS